MKFDKLVESILRESIDYGDKIVFTDKPTGEVITGTVIDPESLRWKKGVGREGLNTYEYWVRYNVFNIRRGSPGFDPNNPFYYLVDGDDDCYHYVSAEDVKKGKTKKAAMDQGLSHGEADTITRI
jgi:hypothetical protein